MNVMGIASLSMSMAQANVRQAISTRVMSKAIGQMRQNGESIVDLLKTGSVPASGQVKSANFDVVV